MSGDLVTPRRVVFLAQRTPPLAGAPATGASAHVASSLAGLSRHCEVLALLDEGAGEPATPAPAALKRLVPASVRGLRQDALQVAADLRFLRRARPRAEAFRPHVVHARNEYLAMAGPRLARSLDVPLVLEVNGVLAEEICELYRSLAQPLAAALERWKVRAADAVVVESPGMASRVVAMGALPGAVHVVPNSVAPERVRAEPPPARPGSAVVGWVGHLMSWHLEGLHRLVDLAPAVARAVPSVSFRIVGGGPGIDEIRAHARSAGVEDLFELRGAVPAADVADVLATFDVGVLPTLGRHDYAFPVKLIDMGAVGLPVVSPRSDSLDALLEPGVEYEPFDAGRPADLADALVRLLREPERRRRMGAALQRAVRERYTWDRTGELLAAAVEAVLARRPPRLRT